MKKRLLALLLAFTMTAACFTGCGTKSPAADRNNAAAEKTETRTYVDDLGREITGLPEKITKIAVSGPLTQVYLLPLAADLMVGVSNAAAKEAEKYLPQEILQLTEIGQIYGSKSELDLEALLAAAPEIVIDVGGPKDSMTEDFNALQEQTGIPFIHLNADVASAPETYRRLGALLGLEEKAEELASWCEKTYASAEALMEKVDADNARKSVLFCLGDKGLNVLAEGSFHAETVNLMAKNVADIADVVSNGDGNETDLEQIMLWNPEIILFDGEASYAAASDPAWKEVTAVKNGNIYKTPYGPYGWLASPPAVQRYLGILWLGALLYPDYVEYNLQEEVTEYYRLFYDCELTDEMYQELTFNSINENRLILCEY